MIEFGVRIRRFPGELHHLPRYIFAWAVMTMIVKVVWPEAITLFYLFWSFFGTVAAGLLNIMVCGLIDRHMSDRI